MSVPAVEAVLQSAIRDGERLVNPQTGRRLAAIIPMHTFGHPVDMAGLLELAARFGLPVVEDAAESLGSFIGEQHTGTFGLLGMLSFNGNKIVTTGGGGVILTDDDELARHAKHLTTTAKVAHAWAFDHDEVGWNFRMPNINAALGVAQLTKLEGYRAAKRALALRYAEAFAGLPDVEFLVEPDGTESNYWLCSVRIDGSRADRDELLRATNEAGLQARPFWSLLSDQLPYRHAPRGELRTAKALEDSVISIPSSPALGGWREERP